MNARHVLDTRPRRRGFLLGLAGLSSLTFVPKLAAAAAQEGERRLAMMDMRRREDLEVAYWRDGDYRPPACEQLDRLLRDHYNDEVIEMDRGLFDVLYTLHEQLGVKEEYRVTCGYRSPQTNAWLAKRRRGVASNSLHMVGKAIDLYLPGVKLRTLRDAARDLKRGGVGYYSRQGFVHLDVGDVRYWAG